MIINLGNCIVNQYLITITAGTVVARSTGLRGSPGIGSSNDFGGTIAISGGTVTACGSGYFVSSQPYYDRHADRQAAGFPYIFFHESPAVCCQIDS